MSIILDKKQTKMTKKMSNILDVPKKSKKETNFDAAKFAVWLRTARENTKPYLNQSDLAKQVNVVRQRISELEGGDKPALSKLPSRPGLDLVEAMAIALDVDLNEARVAAGYSTFNYKTDDEILSEGLFSGYYELSEEHRKIARKQIAAVIRSFTEKDFED